MKPVLLYGAVFVLCVVVVTMLFWRPIMTTLAWYTLQHEIGDNQVLTLTPRTTLPLPDRTDTDARTPFQTLSIPAPTDKTELRNASSTLVVTPGDSGQTYILSSITPFAQQFVNNPNLTVESKNKICSGKTRPLLLNPCADNQVFVQTVLSVTPDDVSLFSTRETKVFHTVFVSLKQLYVPLETEQMYMVTTDTLQGYLAYSPTRSLAFVFDQAGVGYEMAFFAMDQAAIATVLQHIKPLER